MFLNTFVAINYIQCTPENKDNFEYVSSIRASAIDSMPGFITKTILKPKSDDNTYLVVSVWDNEDSFLSWNECPEFHEEPERNYLNTPCINTEGKLSVMNEALKTYTVIAL